ncbi:MAG: hypothetical protein KGR98_12765, partial [Verrucomicrobia bacterium]|nr:hypothetical protein [Verrucomicrobiota bacterium]
VDAILQIPPATEPPTSPMGQQRLYNQADLILLVYDNQVVAEGGLSSGSVPLTWSNVSSFVNTNVSFYDKREGKTIQTTEINVGALKTWNDSGNAVTAALGRNIESVYVADLRTQSSSSEPGVRVTNGQFLPADGLTLATPDPLYVEGNYNAPTSDLGTSDTSGTVPAALIGDSINVLSANWSDTNSALGITNRTACDTTVNAAVLCGIVPSGNGYYSGGVENFFRLLENWKGSQLTYNGSMVVMFPSQIATAPWQNPGTIYIPPTTRLWSFDSNFTDPDKLPHIFPAVRVIVRTQWTALPTT